MHGYAYKKDKYIIGYESNNVIYYVDGMQEMGVNLMIEQSCNILVKDLEQLLNKIMELKNEEKIYRRYWIEKSMMEKISCIVKKI